MHLVNPGINWVAPTIFDAASEPGILLPLVLANAASPQLWRLRDRILAAQHVGTELSNPIALLRAFQVGLNRLLTHTSPLEVAGANGCFDLKLLAARLGQPAIDTALARIRATLSALLTAGQLDPARYDLEPLIASGRFPAYTYATVDGIAASGRYLGRASRRPFGLTCCLDEVALLASLLLISPQGAMDGLAVLANPVHYSLFGWSGAQSWWFYGKNELLFSVAPAVLEQRLAGASMLVTPRGSWSRSSGCSSIPAAELERLIQRLQDFFGCLPEELEPQHRPAIRFVDPSPMDGLVQGALQCQGVAEVQALLVDALGHSGAAASAARTVFTCARYLPGADLVQLLVAARQGPRLQQAQGAITADEAAVALVRAIGGTSSNFDDRDRLAQPEETLKFRTGSDRDKAVLLHVLLEHLHGVGCISTVLEPEHSLVKGPSGTFCTALMDWVDDPAQALTGGAARLLQQPAEADQPGAQQSRNPAFATAGQGRIEYRHDHARA